MATSLKDIGRSIETSGSRSQAVIPQSDNFVPQNYPESRLAVFRSEFLENSYEKFGDPSLTQQAALRSLIPLLSNED